MLDLSLELKTAIAAAESGSKIVSRYASEGIASMEKSTNGSAQGLVTKADVESEQAIVSCIKKTFPDHHFLGEESHSDDIDAENLWIIDPLDGTNNFAHGIPHFGVSVAYYHAGKAICGVVINPTTGEVFTAEQGRGAFRNGERASVNLHTRLDETMIATGFYYDRGQMMETTLAAIGDLFRQNIHGIRRFGAATLDLVSVGLGHYGAFFEMTLSPWDFAASKLFVEEAGGKVTTCSGTEVLIQKTSILASNGSLHSKLMKVLRPHIADNK